MYGVSKMVKELIMKNINKEVRNITVKKNDTQTSN